MNYQEDFFELKDNEQYDSCIDICDNQYNQTDDTVWLFRKADICILQSKIFEAIDIYNQLISDDKHNPVLYYQLWLCYYQKNNIEKSILNYKLASDLYKDNDIDTLYNLWYIYYDLKKYKNATYYFQKLLTIEPDNQEIQNIILKIWK